MKAVPPSDIETILTQGAYDQLIDWLLEKGPLYEDSVHYLLVIAMTANQAVCLSMLLAYYKKNPLCSFEHNICLRWSAQKGYYTIVKQLMKWPSVTQDLANIEKAYALAKASEHQHICTFLELHPLFIKQKYLIDYFSFLNPLEKLELERQKIEHHDLNPESPKISITIS